MTTSFDFVDSLHTSQPVKEVRASSSLSASFGATGAQVIATLFVASLIVPAFVQSTGRRSAWVRIVHALLMSLGLFAGILSAAVATTPGWVTYVTVVGVAAGVGAVAGPAIDGWIGDALPGKKWNSPAQFALALGLAVAPTMVIIWMLEA